MPLGHVDFGKAKPCTCRRAQRVAKQRVRLEGLDGLTEEERLLTFEDYTLTEENRQAYQAVTLAATRGKGVVLLHGPYGVGKSRLLIAAVNETRNAGKVAVYNNMASVLDYLRSAFNPQKGEAGYEERWELLLSAPMLVIDELDKFATTPWAMEKFTQLVHERYRYMGSRLTMMASNATPESLPGDLRSRFADGRSMVVAMGGMDLRPYNEW